jgi:hypothetical protein
MCRTCQALSHVPGKNSRHTVPGGADIYLSNKALVLHCSVNIVLLPVKRGVGLNDYVLVRGLLELINKHGLAGLERLGNFRMHAEREIRAFVVRGSHLPRFGLNLVAERRDGLDHARAGAIRAWLAENALERLLGALAGDADQAELVEGERL